MADYINSATDEETTRPEKTGNSFSGWSKLFVLVGVSFGLLCIIQSALNISLRIRETEFCNRSELIHSTNVTVGLTPDLITPLTIDELAEGNGERCGNYNSLSKNYKVLVELLAQQQEAITQLQTEKDRLTARLSKVAHQQLQSCSLGWWRFRSSCYQMSNDRESWEFAKRDCEMKGAHLVVVNDDAEEEVFQSLGELAAWIGLRARWTQKMKIWTWLDRRQLTNARRIQPQPDDDRLHCAYTKRFTPGSVTWVRAACGEWHHWLCEKELK